MDSQSANDDATKSSSGTGIETGSSDSGTATDLPSDTTAGTGSSSHTGKQTGSSDDGTTEASSDSGKLTGSSSDSGKPTDLSSDTGIQTGSSGGGTTEASSDSGKPTGSSSDSGKPTDLSSDTGKQTGSSGGGTTEASSDSGKATGSSSDSGKPTGSSTDAGTTQPSSDSGAVTGTSSSNDGGKVNKVIEEYIPEEFTGFLDRRLSDIALVTWYGLNTPIIILWPMIYFSIVYFPVLWWVILGYAAWMYIDRKTPYTGGRRMKWFCEFTRLLFDKYLRHYFPVGIVKTCELPPDRNYLFCMFPHGVLAFSCMVNFGWCRTKFEQFYPKLVLYCFTLNINWLFPFNRDALLSCGGLSADEQSIITACKKCGTGLAGSLVVGGASEAFQADRGVYKILAKKRKGYIRVGLKAGASLVPVFSFGENDLYELIHNKYARILQNVLYKLTNVAFVTMKGQNWGPIPTLLPKRRRITAVIGRPIHLPQIDNPTAEDVAKYHQIFIDELTLLFEEHKEKYDPLGANAKLIYV